MRESGSDLVDVRDALAAGEVGAVELIDRLDAARERIDPVLGSFLAAFPSEARHAAQEHDRLIVRGEPLPPLSGVPLGIKALFAMREQVPTAQSLVYDGTWWRGRDADAVAALRGAGGVLMGHNTMAEHAVGRPDPQLSFPIPRNPWDLRRTAGGSSSGTANGVAAGLFAGGLGTDSTGSIRIPAALCGVTGLKPTWDLVSTAGCLPAAPSLDCAGPIARSARDIRVLMETLAPGSMSGSAPLQRRIGVPAAFIDAQRSNMSRDTQNAFEDALSVFESLGVSVVEIDLPELDELAVAANVLMIAEMYEIHRATLEKRWGEYGRSFRRIVAAGASISAGIADTARRRAVELRHAVEERMRDVDAVVTPTWPAGAALLGADDGPRVDDAQFVVPWSASGMTALTIPAGSDEEGMPLAVQIVGATGRDEGVVRLGERFQSVSEHHRRVPEWAPDAVAPPFPTLAEAGAGNGDVTEADLAAIEEISRAIREVAVVTFGGAAG